MIPNVVVDETLLAQLAAELDLRDPNRRAIHTLAHHLAKRAEPGFEGVFDLATGVGKTFVLAGAMQYLADQAGVRHFAIIAPGKTILTKTVGNFTPGGRKSLSDKMTLDAYVVTRDNFDSPETRAALDDADRVKLFVFTVQSLLGDAPTEGGKAGSEKETRRKVHTFTEGLGEPLYAYLQKAPDLVVFADEHHCYYGPAFSKAIRELRPFALMGLTATPHPKTPPALVVFRYPLAHAIADQLVKIPVIVGRHDGRTDDATKLADAKALLDAKQAALDAYTGANGLDPRRALMLIVAPSIPEAQEVEASLTDLDGLFRYPAGEVLRVDSSQPDEALEALEHVEDPESKVRIIVSVGMLKEGWDVSTVYVIVSLRASVSDILTEQTLGRGLRLPFGRYTDAELLNTLEVVAHERYEELLRRTGVLRERLVDHTTMNSAGDTGRAPARGGSSSGGGHPAGGGGAPGTTSCVNDSAGAGPASQTGQMGFRGFLCGTTEQRVADATAQAKHVSQLAPRQEIQIPVVTQVARAADFSLAKITEMAPYRQIGRQWALDPAEQLKRTKVAARIVTDATGVRRTEIVTSEAEHIQGAIPGLLDKAHIAVAIRQRILAHGVTVARPSEAKSAGYIVNAVLDGAGDKAAGLAHYLDQLSAAVIRQIRMDTDAFLKANVILADEVSTAPLAKVRTARDEVSEDRFGKFAKGAGYVYTKSVYEQDWFDSSPERDTANILDADGNGIARWVRLQRGDLPILWSGMGNYNPDFVAIGDDGVHWLIEVKADNQMTAPEVLGKKAAAEAWAAKVSVEADTEWKYLLVSETNVRHAKGAWKVLRAQYQGR